MKSLKKRFFGGGGRLREPSGGGGARGGSAGFGRGVRVVPAGFQAGAGRRYTADYRDEHLPFGLAGKAWLNADRGEGGRINCRERTERG